MTEGKEKGHTMIASCLEAIQVQMISKTNPMQSNRIDAYPQAALKRSSNCFSRVTINDNIMIMNNSP
jgi:hypothetical protein